MSAKRIEWIDQVKGFAIICMVISHAIPGYTNGLKNWITSFNMPLFFFVSGCLAKDMIRDWKELLYYLRKKFHTIGIPYFFFCIVYLLFIAALSVLAGTDQSTVIGELLSGLKNILFMFGIQSMWFLPVHFFAMMIFDFGVTRTDKKTVRPLLVLGIITVLLTISRSNAEFSMWIRLCGKTLAALVFVIAGNLLRKAVMKMKAPIILSALIAISVLSVINGFVSVNFEYGNYPVLFFVNAIILSLCICSLFMKIEAYTPPMIHSVLDFYGRDTIVVLVTNNLVIEILRLLDYKLTGDFFLNHGTAGCLLFAVLILVLEYPVILLAQYTNLSVLFGKRRKDING